MRFDVFRATDSDQPHMQDSKQFDETTIIGWLRTRQSANIERAVRRLFEDKALFIAVSSKIIEHKGDTEDAMRCFKRALIQLSRLAKSGDLDVLPMSVLECVLHISVEYYYEPILTNRKQLMDVVVPVIKAEGGQHSDAEESLQSGLVKFIYDLRDNTYDPNRSSAKTYIVNKSTESYRSAARTTGRDGTRSLVYIELTNVLHEPSAETQLLAQERSARMLVLFDKMGGNCQELIYLFAQGYTHQEICDMKGYSSAGSARNAVHNCLDKLQQHLKQHPKDIELFNKKT